MNEYSDNIKGGSLNSKLWGMYRAQVIDSNNEVVADYGWHKNLILNQGMDAIYVQLLGNLNRYGIAGTGSRPNSISSGDSTITQSGNIIELWPSGSGLQNFSSSISASSPYEIYYSSSLQTGDWIVYGNGSRSVVMAIDSVSGLTASLSQSYSIESGSNQPFTIWKTSQVGLQKEIKRAGQGITNSDYLTSPGGCGSTDNVAAATRTYRRTYDFVSESVNISYTELGVTWATSGANTVFSRMVPPSPIIVSSSFRLRLTHDFYVAFTPYLSRSLSASISGWPIAPATNTNASESLQTFLASTVTTSGITSGITACFDPAGMVDATSTTVQLFNIFIASNTTALSPFGSATSRGTNVTRYTSGPTGYPYVTGSYTAYKSNDFGLNDANYTDIKSIGFGRYSSGNSWTPSDSSHQAYCMLFEQTQSKLNTQTFSLTWKFSWNRVLA